ncbi:uncharacterized protein LOC113552618 [Rhopalosiphum maidis]|uniref:uncharacterized protein LOC113552618 n=1 Tax=Rhopalosiphum maidis TaxID=43146 RepID=UPI000EFFD743|nr:uncharacterized protein LOC113552618 [Rhopalosiphum maidis]
MFRVLKLKELNSDAGCGYFIAVIFVDYRNLVKVGAVQEVIRVINVVHINQIAKKINANAKHLAFYAVALFGHLHMQEVNDIRTYKESQQCCKSDDKLYSQQLLYTYNTSHVVFSILVGFRSFGVITLGVGTHGITNCWRVDRSVMKSHKRFWTRLPIIITAVV